MDSTYDYKTQQNATLTRQEEEGDVQLKVSYFDFSSYFDFWTILVHGSFDDSSHFVHVNYLIDTHYVWAASGSPSYRHKHLRYSVWRINETILTWYYLARSRRMIYDVGEKTIQNPEE